METSDVWMAYKEGENDSTEQQHEQTRDEWYMTKYQWTEWAQQKTFHSWTISWWEQTTASQQ